MVQKNDEVLQYCSMEEKSKGSNW